MELNKDGSAVERKKALIKNSRGYNLVGILHETGSKEIVIICHGLRSSKDRIPMINLAVAFEKEGISAFRFDFTGTQDSEGPFSCGEPNIELDDLHAVVQHFRMGQNRHVAALIGHSKGGNTVTIYASSYHDIKCIVNISGCFSLMNGLAAHLGQDFMNKIEHNGFIEVKSRNGSARITKEQMMDGLNIDTHASCQKIDENCSVFIVHGLMDEFVPIDDALKFSESIKHSKLHFIEGADHEYTSKQDELCTVVVDFMREKLPAHRNPHSFIQSRI